MRVIVGLIAFLVASSSLLFAQGEWNKEVPFQPSAPGATPTIAILNLAGVGAVLNKVEGRCVITQIVPGSGAQEAGLKVSDVITHVDQKDISTLDLPQIASMLRGDPDTIVILKVERTDVKKPLEIEVTRHPVKLNDSKIGPERDSTISRKLAAIYADLKAIAIPIPQTTPFDSDSRRRDSYLAGFRKGWDFAISGQMLHGTQIAPTGMPSDLFSAWQTGADEGRKLGGEQLKARLDLNK